MAERNATHFMSCVEPQDLTPSLRGTAVIYDEPVESNSHSHCVLNK
jgi:hypothetical protein